ncbi:BON domain-containing protein [Flavobacterium sp. CHNK8]|uniref:BON domain-containing protein n=1 Tax=Flavobacterium sp. CHNK8 TaxID=2871165 RepID=UPI001C8D7249|nr:BON domain-containing protein [Flavobacterium sp. CHNK8]QZK90450.1 BON domain-containing protein [Flavobacterium sp. CHNK8]
MITDDILRQNVIQALKWDLFSVDCIIIVISNNGVITLKGNVDTYKKKTQAERISSAISGVQSVINKIDVTINRLEQKKDIAITNEILTVFRWNWNTLNDTIKVKVLEGWVTLSGELEWNYQKEAARQAIVSLIGVKGVSNKIKIKSQSGTKIDKTTLRLALENHLALDSKDIEIEVLDSKIILKGTVESWYQKEIAGFIAWKTRGVISVENELLIEE